MSERGRPFHWKPSLTALAQEMRDDGESWAEIAREIGCATCTVRRQIDPGYREYRAGKIRNARHLRNGMTVDMVVNLGLPREGRVTKNVSAQGPTCSTVPAPTKAVTLPRLKFLEGSL